MLDSPCAQEVQVKLNKAEATETLSNHWNNFRMPYSYQDIQIVYIEHIQQKYDFNYKLKQQHSALVMIANGEHTFVVLPTGYGQTDIFILAPLIMDVL